MRILFLFLPLLLIASDFIIKYQNLKPFYYKNQIVNLKFKVISSESNLTFFSNTELNITKINPYIYELNTKFKADENNKTITIISPTTKKIINLNNIISIKPLLKIKNFSQVLATNLYIKNPISSKYDNNQTILYFQIECQNCNLKDFNLSKQQKLKLLSKNQAMFYIILPKNQKKLEFYYFNTLENKFDKIEVPIILKENTISTQTDINPNENKFFTPSNLFILVLIAISLIIFLIYQKIWLLIFPFIFSILILIQFIPKGEVVLKKGTKLQILPTPTSTVFYIVKKDTKVKILNKRDHYIKVKIDNKIGWINENK